MKKTTFAALLIITLVYPMLGIAQETPPNNNNNFEIIDPYETGKALVKGMKCMLGLCKKKKALANLPANQENIAQVKKKKYKIKKSNLKKVRKAILKRKNSHVGETKWDYIWTAKTDNNGRITNAVSVVKTTIKIPKWTKVSKQCAAVQKEWERFIVKVIQHEQGHAKIIADYFRNSNITKNLRGKTKDEAKRMISRAKAQIKSLQNDYHKRVGSDIKLNYNISC